MASQVSSCMAACPTPSLASQNLYQPVGGSKESGETPYTKLFCSGLSFPSSVGKGSGLRDYQTPKRVKFAAPLHLQLSFPCISSKEAFQARFESAKQCLFPEKRSVDNYRLLSRLLDAV